MHRTPHSRIQFHCTMLFHHCIVLWIFRHTWKQPHFLETPVREEMESWWSCDLKFESNSRLHHNLSAHVVSDLILMGLIRNPPTSCTVWELTIASGFQSRCYSILWNKVDIPSVFCPVNTGVQILVGEICIVHVLQVHQFEIGSLCHLVDDTLECLCHSGHCYHLDWFMGWCKCWMPLRWSCVDP